MSEKYNPSSRPYKANRGEIASPADPIVNDLKRRTGKSLPVNHNMKADIPNPGGKSQIVGPATDSIVSPRTARKLP